MVTLIATAGATDANSYVTRADATTYLEDNRLHTADWTSASNDDKDSSLIWATTLLDVAFEWEGAKRTLTQALRFPRSGIMDADGDWLDYDTIPTLLERATAELAFFLIQTDRTVLPDVLGLGFSEFKLGPIAAKIDSARVPELIPDIVVMMLAPLGELKAGSTNADRVMKTMRT